MQSAIAPGLLTEADALAALDAAGPHLGAEYNMMRAALAVAPVLYCGFGGYGAGARQICLAESVRMLRAVFVVRRVMAQQALVQVGVGVAPVARRAGRSGR